jgi:signal transduction histidine kinase
MQIRQRLTLQFLVWVSGIVLLAFLAIYLITYQAVTDVFYDRLESKAVTTAELLLKVEEVDSRLLRLIEKSNRDVLYKENILIYEGNRLLYASNDSIRFVIDSILFDEIRQEGKKRFAQQDFSIVGLLYEDENNRAVVLAGGIDRFGKLTLRNLRHTLFSLFFFIVLLVGGTGWLYAGKALKPIADITREVNSIFPQRLGQRIGVPNPNDELGQLAQTMNALLNRIEEAFVIQKNFIANVSHELRNPLTAISAQLEVSLLNQRPPEAYRQTIGSVLEDIRELNRLAANLLQLAKLSSEPDSVPFGKVRMDELLWDAREFLRNLHPTYRIQIALEELPENDRLLYRLGNATLLKIAFVNLMENACKFSENQSVVVTFAMREEQMRICFHDDGIGIPTEDIPFIFQPFYRTRQTADLKGYGIGLSLVEQIVRIHQGTVSVSSAPGQGTAFILTFDAFDTAVHASLSDSGVV